MRDLTTFEQDVRRAAVSFAHILGNYVDWVSEDEDLIDETPSCKEENQAYLNLKMTIDSAVEELLTAYKKYKSSEQEREELYNELFGEEDREEDEEE